ncbi:RNA polymerase sigma24 factor [Actinocatenispora thailandica]|uniref:RNA polymerase sigma24 factor n=1 Tax=Actinocatenispora thailandica TaxID=227318 RepID=A0A7R7HWS4_9ACTN|nr:SigE family RNA polymerase sigma factor [Actinocatenispora thailandica]BCJ34388.1 RNA polymerase sigma24 factor [Actinocatenispora thailandica]
MKKLDGFTEFVTARLPALTRLGFALTGDHQLAEDLVQTALFRLAQRWGRVDEPQAYARRIMINESTSWHRRRRLRETSLAAAGDPAAPVEVAESVTRREAFIAALRRLTPKQRAVLALRYYEDLSEVDTAAALGCSVGTVKSRTHQAIRRLRELAPELAIGTDRSLAEEVAR